MTEEIKEQIKHYCTIRFNEDELSYLSSIEWLHEDYVAYLRLWKPRYEDFDISKLRYHKIIIMTMWIVFRSNWNMA